MVLLSGNTSFPASAGCSWPTFTGGHHGYPAMSRGLPCTGARASLQRIRRAGGMHSSLVDALNPSAGV
jgi:hypothetical protein